MEIKSLKRNFFQRALGIPATNRPKMDSCWNYANGKLSISLSEASELKAPGGAARFEGKSLPVRILVVHGEDGEYRAFQNRCTHIGHRRLDPVPGTHTVQCCSINKSTYDSDGNRIFGPAPQPVTRYPVARDQKNLIVSIA